MASLVKKAKLQHEAAGFTEVIERGRGSITSRNPITGKSVVSSAVGGVGLHFGAGPFTEENEIDTDWIDADSILDAPWLYKVVQAGYNLYFAPGNQGFDAGQILKYVHPGSGAEVAFQPQQLQWTNDISQISAIDSPQAVTPTITGDRLEFANAFGAGLDFVWAAQGTRLAKFLHISQLSDIGSPPQYIIDGGNPVLRLQFIFKKSSSVGVYVNGVLWNEKSNNPVETIGNIEFRSGGETLWYFRKPAAFDGSTGQVPPPVIRQRLRASAQNLFVDVLVPWAWLRDAVYPVVIDPTVEENPQAAGDDYYGATTPSDIDTGADSLTIGHEDGWTGVYGAVRFPTVTITEGATVDTAYVNFDAFESDSSTTCNVSIWAVDEATPAAATTNGEVSTDVGLSTTATVAWSSIPAWTAGTNYNSAEIKTIIQELLDSYGATFGAGTAHVLLYFWNNSSSANAQRRVSAYGNYKGYDSALLHVEYTESGGATTIPGLRPLGIKKGIARKVTGTL